MVSLIHTTSYLSWCSTLGYDGEGNSPLPKDNLMTQSRLSRWVKVLPQISCHFIMRDKDYKSIEGIQLQLGFEVIMTVHLKRICPLPWYKRLILSKVADGVLLEHQLRFHQQWCRCTVHREEIKISSSCIGQQLLRVLFLWTYGSRYLPNTE